MQTVRAHLKSENKETVKVIVFDTSSGAVLQVKELDVPPTNSEAIPAARSFLATNYKNTNIEITSELIFSISEEGSEPAPTSARLIEAEEEAEGETKTGFDGKLTLAGSTVTELELEPEFQPTLTSGEIEDQPETSILGVQLEPLKVIETKPAQLNSLPDFPDILAGQTPAQINSQLNNYGTNLRQNFLVAGSDFELPAGIQGAGDVDVQFNDDELELIYVNQDRDEGDDATTNISDSEARKLPPPVPKKKRAVQLSGLSDQQREALANDTSNRFKGIAGDDMIEPIPGLIQTKTEKVLSNRYNSWIVLGRDRVSDRSSGYGGRGNTQCASIDIVTGRMSPRPKSVKNSGDKMDIDPIFNLTMDEDNNPVCDAARIYISQKTDVDKNFILASGKVGMAEARSAIAMKADGIRILAREGIKLVTRADRMNSQGGPLDRVFGVDIIAGNDDKSLQPMVLGNNLVLSMEEMAQILSEVIGTVNDLVINVSKLDLALSTHIHPSPFFGAPTLPSPGMAVEAVASLAQLASVTAFSNAAQKFNIVGWRTKYMKPGAKYRIRSKYNNVN